MGVWITDVPDVAAMDAVGSSFTKITLEVMASPVGTENLGVI